MREKAPSGEADGAKPSTLEAVESVSLTDVTSGCRRRPLTRVPLVPPLPVPLCPVGQLAPAFRTRDENHPHP